MIETEGKLKAFDGAISRSAALFAAALMLAVLGAGLVYGVGFAGADVLHNVAHDTRHANGFPCH
jgi:cobalt transporter subunit CbtB